MVLFTQNKFLENIIYRGGYVMRKIKVHIKVFATLILIILSSGCSVGLALSGNEQRDTSVFYEGAERSFVYAKVGMPDGAVQDKDGLWIDTYLIVKGNEPSAGIPRVSPIYQRTRHILFRQRI